MYGNSSAKHGKVFETSIEMTTSSANPIVPLPKLPVYFSPFFRIARDSSLGMINNGWHEKISS